MGQKIVTRQTQVSVLDSIWPWFKTNGVLTHGHLGQPIWVPISDPHDSYSREPSRVFKQASGKNIKMGIKIWGLKKGGFFFSASLQPA